MTIADNTPETNRSDFQHVRLSSGCYFVRWSDAARVVRGEPLEHHVYKVIRVRGEFRPRMAARGSIAEQAFLREFAASERADCRMARDYVAEHPGGW